MAGDSGVRADKVSLGYAHPLHQRLKAAITAQFNKMWVLPDSDQAAPMSRLGLFQPVQRIFFIPRPERAARTCSGQSDLSSVIISCASARFYAGYRRKIFFRI